MKFRSAKELKCSFCGKLERQVRKFIAGPGVYICDECIDLCNEIMEQELPSWEWRRAGERPARRHPLSDPSGPQETGPG